MIRMGGSFPIPSSVRPPSTVFDSLSVGIVGEDTASFDPAMSDTIYGCFFHNNSSSRILVNEFGQDSGPLSASCIQDLKNSNSGVVSFLGVWRILRRMLDGSLIHIVVRAFGMDNDNLRGFPFGILPHSCERVWTLVDTVSFLFIWRDLRCMLNGYS